MHLDRRFSTFNLLLVSINGMIGSAWLFAPLYAAKLAGSAAIIGWLIGGFATILIALTFAELSTLLPVAGGTARIPQLSHGALSSFMLGWIAWISALAMPPIEVQAVLQYASTYFPSLTLLVKGVPVLSHLGLVWAVILLFSLGMINILSFKGLLRFNFLIFFFKFAVIILTIFALIGTRFHSSNFAGMDNYTLSFSGWQSILSAVASGGIAFAFTGFKHGVELAGEAKNSPISIPVSIVGSVTICLILYLGLQLSFIGALEPASLLRGWSKLSFPGDVGPFAGLALGLGLIWLVKLIYIDATVSPLGAGLIYVTSTARILYTMSKMGYLPKFLSALNRQHLPLWSVLTNCALGLLLFLPFPGWQSLVSFLVSAMVISYAIGPIALYCLRLEVPKEKRSFRLPCAKWLAVLAFYCCNLFSYWTGWETISKLSLALILGFALFLVAFLRGRVKDEYIGWQSAFWLLPYLSGLVLISYLGAFGGLHLIPFGWDFLVIALFSVVIFYLAVITRISITEHGMAHYLAVEI